jgi:hypothetical protein
MDLKKADKLYDKFYDKYGKPLEKNHWGDYLAVSGKGETLLGKNYLKVVLKARSTFGPGSFLYKVGEKAIWKWRRLKK